MCGLQRDVCNAIDKVKVSMAISKYNSSKITVLNGLMIIMVLYIHCFYYEGCAGNMSYSLQRFMGTSGIMSVAILLFFVISGFLFFYGIKSIRDCFPKIKRRIHSLVVPYVIWNVIFVVWYVLLHCLPGISSYVNSDILHNFNSLSEAISYMFIAPANFALWFLRDLIVFIAFSPLIYILIKYLRWWVLPLSLIVTYMLPFVGLCYFILGGYVALYSSLESITRLLSRNIVVLCAIIYVGMSAYLSLQPFEEGVFSYNWGLTMLHDITGIITIWRVYDIGVKDRILTEIKWVKIVCGYSFFVYLFHEPTLNIIKKIPLRFLGESELVIIVFFLMNPFIMYAVAVCVAQLLQNIMPRVYGVLVGGR